MKKLLILTTLLTCLIGEAAQTNVWTTGVDFTGRSNITAALITQAINTSKPTNNHGLVIVSYTAPAVATYGVFTNYLWLDVNYTPPILKVWSWGTTNWETATIPANGVTTGTILNGAVTQPKLATNAVATVNIQDSAVTTDKLSAQAVTSGKIATLAINTSNINDSAVTTVKIAASAIVTTNIVDGSITAAKLAGSAINQTNIPANSIAGTNMQINSVLTSNIVVNAIARTNITDGVINTNKLSFYLPEFSAPVTNAPPTAGNIVSFSHGLTTTPTDVRVTLLCSSTDATSGYAVGDELELTAFIDGSSVPVYTYYKTATTVVVICRSGITLSVSKKTDGTRVTPSGLNFSLKVRAWYQP